MGKPHVRKEFNAADVKINGTVFREYPDVVVDPKTELDANRINEAIREVESAVIAKVNRDTLRAGHVLAIRRWDLVDTCYIPLSIRIENDGREIVVGSLGQYERTIKRHRHDLDKIVGVITRELKQVVKSAMMQFDQEVREESMVDESTLTSWDKITDAKIDRVLRVEMCKKLMEKRNKKNQVSLGD